LICKIKKNHELKEYILEKLTIDKWSPEIIAGRIKLKGGFKNISHEAIYQFIYSPEGSKLRLYEHLMYRRERRCIHHNRRHRVRVAPQHSITQRPEIIGNKVEFGHFEGDLTFLKGSNSANFLVLIEKLSRKSFIAKNNNNSSIGIMNKIHSMLKVLPNHARKSITFDNGSEFKKFGILSIAGIHSYFCKPSSPWQKGQVERLNAQLHKFINKSSNIKSVTDDLVRAAQDKLNNLPRKVLKFLTPNEFWDTCMNSNVALQT
jgi:IS30 family transposase